MSLEHCLVDTDQVWEEQPHVNVVWDEELLMHGLGSHEEQKLLTDEMLVYDGASNLGMGVAHHEFCGDWA
jgi:hypothetical protein